MTDLRTQIESWKQTRLAAIATDVGHFVVFAVRRFFAERMNNAAASLTYSTLLALVPLLVIAFAILSSFRAFDAVKERMQAVFFNAVVPEAGAAISDYLSNFTQNASNLTTIGVVALAVAAVLLLSTVEDTLNRVWHVERPRPILVRFLIFWAILTLGPLLIGASFTLSSDLMKFANTSDLLTLGIQAEVVKSGSWILESLAGFAINIVGFTALFVLVPARRVRIRHALIGAIFAAVSFGILGWGFNRFLTSGSSYETIYGAVAAVPVFLVWIYTSWMVIILGAVFAASFPDWWLARSGVLGVTLRPSDRLEITMSVLAKLLQHAKTGGVIDEEELVTAAPLNARNEVLDRLRDTGYVVETDEGCLALSRDLHATTMRELAVDLGLALGVDPTQPGVLPDEVTRQLVRETAETRRLLVQLHKAEAQILDISVAQAILASQDVTAALPASAAQKD
ncbi:YihY family inner membrane protein [Puniceibacterium sp. IMCC21224]|uniref:YihY family inner membrane protein n=1 Tax=Puniceibacterium sp. IMCC21224 TaxID=1618204 RepID=UPI0018CF88B5|nr:YihY family inner membrane protein [Puniceibacterium sp. IMCC21224]